jgi:hypothetical protein
MPVDLVPPLQRHRSLLHLLHVLRFLHVLHLMPLLHALPVLHVRL